MGLINMLLAKTNLEEITSTYPRKLPYDYLVPRNKMVEKICIPCSLLLLFPKRKLKGGNLELTRVP